MLDRNKIEVFQLRLLSVVQSHGASALSNVCVGRESPPKKHLQPPDSRPYPKRCTSFQLRLHRGLVPRLEDDH